MRLSTKRTKLKAKKQIFTIKLLLFHIYHIRMEFKTSGDDAQDLISVIEKIVKIVRYAGH